MLEQKTRLERRRGEGEGQGIVSTGTVISCRMENENPFFLDIRVLYSSGIGSISVESSVSCYFDEKSGGGGRGT